jgi:hypothetical protein
MVGSHTVFDRAGCVTRVTGEEGIEAGFGTREAAIRWPKPDELRWTSDDHAVFAEWRRAVIALYGALGLLFVAALGTHHLANVGLERGTAVEGKTSISLLPLK